MTYTTTISSKGQITLPAAIRRQLNVRLGDRLQVNYVQGKAVIQRDNYDERLAAVRAHAKKHLEARGLSGLSIEEIRKRADKAKLEDYIKRHGIRP